MSNDGQNPDEQERPGDSEKPDASRPPVSSGFGMLDWLTLPTEEREIIVWLTRRQRASREEIEAAFGGVYNVDVLLEDMLAGNYIRLDDSVFSVVYRHTQKRATRDFPDDIWSRVDSKAGRRKDSSGDPNDSGA